MAIVIPDHQHDDDRVSERANRLPIASRLAGDRAHRDMEQGKLGPDRLGGVLAASAACHVWHYKLTTEQEKESCVCCPIRTW